MRISQETKPDIQHTGQQEKRS